MRDLCAQRPICGAPSPATASSGASRCPARRASGIVIVIVIMTITIIIIIIMIIIIIIMIIISIAVAAAMINHYCIN